MSDQDGMDNWKQFQGTELGALMSQLYGNQNKPKINYPKMQRKKIDSEQKMFIPGGAKLEAKDPRKATRRVVNIDVPKQFQQRNESIKPIDVINRRRSADSIKAEIDEIKLKQSHFRPAYVQPISGAEEKERLNQIFTFKGGKGLPSELTHPVGEMPLELESRRKEMERMDAVRAKRGLGPSSRTLDMNAKSAASRRVSAPLSEREQLADQVRAEIEERREHLQEMLELGGLKPEKEKQMKLEIERKVAELQRLL